MPRTPTGASAGSTEPEPARVDGASDFRLTPAPSRAPGAARGTRRRSSRAGAAAPERPPATPRALAEPPEAPESPAGRSLVARRALLEVVRNAALGSYGVASLAAPTRLARLRGRLGLGDRSVQVALQPEVSAQVWLEVAYGLPVAEVARQVDSAVRYELERAVGRAVGSVTIHVQGLRGRPFTSRADGAEEATGDGSGSAASPVADGRPGDAAVPAGAAPAARSGGEGASANGAGPGERPA